MTSSESENRSSSSSEKRLRNPLNRSKFALAITAAATVVAVVVLGFILFGGLNKERENIYKTDAFFIPSAENGDMKYALYKNNGDKLTDFVFKQHGEFIDGYAYVENSDGKPGIIDHEGKMSVDYDVYASIKPRVGIYEANKDGQNVLIRGNGDEIARDYASYDYSAVAPYVVVKKDSNHYELYNAFGEKLANFDSENAPKITDDDAKTASAVNYDGGLIILNNKSYKAEKIVETSTRYDIKDTAKDGKVITFVEKDKHYDKDAKRAIFNKDFIELENKCDDTFVNDNFKNKERFYLSCQKDNKEYLIRNNEVTDVVITTYGDGNIIYDENHYVKYESESKKATFYVNGENKKTVDANYRPVASTNGYTVNDYSKKSVILYDTEGNEVHKLEDAASSSELTGVDENNNIIIRDGKQDSDKKYVLINKEGKEISERYSAITAHGKYYSAFKQSIEKTAGDLLDKDGQVIISGDYSEFVFYDDEEIILGKKGVYGDRKFDLIDVKEKSVKATFEDNAAIVGSSYFRSESDKEIIFYTLDGKQIHSFNK